MLYVIFETVVEMSIFTGKKLYQLASWMIYGHQETEVEKLEKIVHDLNMSISELNSKLKTSQIEMTELKT